MIITKLNEPDETLSGAIQKKRFISVPGVRIPTVGYKKDTDKRRGIGILTSWDNSTLALPQRNCIQSLGTIMNHAVMCCVQSTTVH